ncbi:dihydroneopterin aldolase [Polyangium sp. 6x1]|uniref:dihydroneopterin aldolase n=1 Tax=Polyangium sp. 6x1 TaxID=3042689 RepID=UPI00248300F6|nr:dihydroneopterin aldolase [Polyangium sp. 6x1]MDI1451926.1 dihydroneopterin aldolase [Polyangium sp. 6x1]
MTHSNRTLMERDIVTCHGLELDVQIGFHDIELNRKQTVSIDLTIETDFRVGPDRDHHEGLADYYVIANLLEKHVADRKYDLVEALAVDIARVVLRANPTVRVRVRVNKRPLDMPRVRVVGVECVRSAEDFADEVVSCPPIRA